MNQESTETRLLRTVAKLIEICVHDTAIGVSAADSSLAGWGGTLARLASSEFRARVMNGMVDLLNVTPDELEGVIAECVSAAHGRLTQAKFLATPRGGGSPPSV